MDKQALTPEFWDVFVRDYWNQKPVVFKGVLPKDLLTDMDVLQAFGNYAEDSLSQGQKPPSKRKGGFARLFVEGRQIGPMELIKFMPQGSNLTEYVGAVGATFGGARVGVILNDVELFNERAAKAIRGVVAPLIERIGIPAKNVESTIFAGDYDVTPFGIHKDESAEVLTLIIAGKKQMLVWPQEYFDEHPERLQMLPLGNEAISHFIQDATVLEAHPGDLMYWPGSAYHVATSAGGVVATCGIGFWHKALPSDAVGELGRELVASKLGSQNTVVAAWKPGSVPPPLQGTEDVLRQLVASGEFQKALAQAWQGRVERLGFLANDPAK